MRVVHSLAQLPDNLRHAVVALGNFDGVHLGHRQVLDETVRQAKALGAPPAVLTFSPHPREFFSPTHKPHCIYSLREKLHLLASDGIEIVYLARFDERLAATPAGQFIDGILCGELAARHIVTGENFIFGQGRAGNASLLSAAAQTGAFGYTRVPAAQSGELTVSTSRVREALKTGDVQAASTLLGRAYAISGRVVRGQQRGRTLGFPTANIGVAHRFAPRLGVYAAWVENAAGERFPAVANLGVKPTFGLHALMLEAHCLIPPGELYGQRLHVELVAFLRGEERFDTVDALKNQIARDVAGAKQTLGIA